MTTLKYLAYLRVSTKKQERSGLGLDAQRAIIEHYARIDGAIIEKEVVEAESGKDTDNRPLLRAAIDECSKKGYTLIVAKLDRLSRDVQDTFGILKQLNGRLKSCDIPTIDSFTLAIFAGLAQRERELISLRTKLALAEKKRKGIALGTARNLTNDHRVRGNQIAAAKTDRFRTDRRLTSMVESCYREGMTNQQIAETLNGHDFKTYRNKPYNAFSAHRLVKSIIHSKNKARNEII